MSSAEGVADREEQKPKPPKYKTSSPILASGRNCPSGQVISWLWPYRGERAKYRKTTHTCGGGQMALEFAIFRADADACTWQESPRNLAAARARAELLGEAVSSLVYKRASRKPPCACL